MDLEPVAVPSKDRIACTVQGQASLVLRPDGSVLAVWWDWSRGDLAYPVWSVRRAGTWSKPAAISATRRGYWQRGDIWLWCEANGTATAVWLSSTKPSERGQRVFSRLGASDDAWSEPEEFVVPGVFPSDVVLSPDGALHVVGAPKDGGPYPVYARRDPSMRWSPVTLLRSGPQRTVLVDVTGGPSPRRETTNGHLAKLAIGTDGRAIAAWWDDERTLGRDAGMDLRFATYDPAAARWSEPQWAEVRAGLQPWAAVAAAGADLHVVGAAEDGRLIWRRLVRGPEQPEPVVLVPGRASDPKLRARADGAVLLTWCDHAAGLQTSAALLEPGSSRWRELGSAAPGKESMDHAAIFQTDGSPLLVYGNRTRERGCKTLDRSELTTR